MLRIPQATRLRAIATTGDLSGTTARAITWLRANYARPLHMEELAEIAKMGMSTLHHQFRTLTAMNPLQYQKRLRLQTARQRMLMDGLDATSAAYEVGYESVSQFSREYSRFCASVANYSPMPGCGVNFVIMPGEGDPPTDDAHRVGYERVGPGYFETIGQPLV